MSIPCTTTSRSVAPHGMPGSSRTGTIGSTPSTWPCGRDVLTSKSTTARMLPSALLPRRNASSAWCVMSRDGIILYGPPASGKDAITEALSRISPECVLFRKLKAGDGRREGYRLTTLPDIERMQRLGLIVYANERYANVYAVDRPSLGALLAQGLVPVVHMGQLVGVRALKRYPAACLSVLLWCPRDLAEQRLRGRGAVDLAARLPVWDETA